MIRRQRLIHVKQLLPPGAVNLEDVPALLTVNAYRDSRILTTDPQRLDAYTAAALDPTGADPTLTTEFNAIYQECGIQP